MLQVRQFNFKPFTIVKCDLLSKKLALPTIIEFELEVILSRYWSIPS